MTVASDYEDGRHERQLYAEGADAAVDALSWQAGLHRANGDLTRLQETETWLALAREDQAAAAAGIDYRDLAAMGTESVLTEPAPCCEYPFGQVGGAEVDTDSDRYDLYRSSPTAEIEAGE